MTPYLGTLPLAALTDEASDHLDEVVNRIEARLRQDASPALTEKLLTGTYLLLGLRYTPDQIPETLRRNRIVEESSTFQFVLRRGRVEEARLTFLRQGKTRFGQPADAVTQSQIDGITDLDRLHAMTDRIPFVSSWADLLAET